MGVAGTWRFPRPRAGTSRPERLTPARHAFLAGLILAASTLSCQAADPVVYGAGSLHEPMGAIANTRMAMRTTWPSPPVLAHPSCYGIRLKLATMSTRSFRPSLAEDEGRSPCSH